MAKYKNYIDNKRECSFEGCTNIGEWNCAKNGRIYRRRYCSTHRARLKGKTFKYRMKNDKNRNCEYCGWEGPCDIHRPIAGKDGGKYAKNNCRSICPNCHRLISYGLIDDKFLIRG